MLGFAKARKTIDTAPTGKTVVKYSDQVFNERLNSITADEGYAQDLIDTAKTVLMRAAIEAAELEGEVDAEIRLLMQRKSDTQVVSGRAAFLSDAVGEPLATVTA